MAGAPVLSPQQTDSSVLQQAQQLMLSEPQACVALTQRFLQRKEIDPAQLVNSRQEFDHQAMNKHYRSREQSLTAWQIQTLCLANQGLLDTALTSLDQGIKLAKRYRHLDSQAASFMIKAKLALEKHQGAAAKQWLDKAKKLISPDSDFLLHNAWLLLKASSLLQQHKLEEARQLFEQARMQAQKQPHPQQQAWANYLLADYYQLLQQDELAVSHYIETLNLLGQQQHYYLKAIAAEKTATLKAELGQHQQAMDYANLATSEFELLDNRQLLIGSLLNLGRVTRTSTQDASLALVYFFNALDLAKTRGDSELLAQLYLEIGHSYRLLDNRQEAHQYLIYAKERFKHHGNTPQHIDALHQLGQLYLAQQEQGLALLQFEQALTLAKRSQDSPRLIESHRLLAHLYELSHNPSQALIHHKAFHDYFAKDSQLNQLLTQSLVQDKEQQLQQERAVAALQNKSQSLRQDRRALSVVTAGLAILLPLFMVMYWRKRKHSHHLVQQNFALSRSLLLESRTGLPNWRQLMVRLPKEMSKSQLRSEQWYLDEAQAQPFNDKIYYLLIHVPFMVDLNERLGLIAASQLQQELGLYLHGRIHPQARLYDLREGQFMYVISQRQVSSLSQTLANIEHMFLEFPSHYHLNRRLAIGIIGHPFLPKAPEH
ncbi:tetratricopeptide repeat protein [Oceanisphaera avium]|uniref:GGDEF domain-containing protein n=1 Tax=Oceanisphaera avium TaxID=1903694 RepID=UPI001E549D30|nr:GGDEF domain-containing protein [Oceanisphaera avium]